MTNQIAEYIVLYQSECLKSKFHLLLKLVWEDKERYFIYLK